MKLAPKQFVEQLLPFAQNAFGFNPAIILTQAALESGWGSQAPGNAYFGVKDTDGANGNEQLLDTTEISRSNILKPEQVGLVSVDRIVPCTINGQKYFTYYGKGYFRKYPTPKESFDDHIQFFLNNGIYAKACTLRDQPLPFFMEIARVGYATAPNYAQELISTYRAGISPYIKN